MMDTAKRLTGIGAKLVNPKDGHWVRMYSMDPKNPTKQTYAVRSSCPCAPTKGTRCSPASARVREQGEVLISLEVMPKAVAAKRKAGLGRHAPNMNPFLPPPTGRMKFVRSAAVCLGWWYAPHHSLCFRRA